MRIVFFKAVHQPKSSDDEKMPVEDKLRLIMQDRVENADDERERERAQRDLDKLG